MPAPASSVVRIVTEPLPSFGVQETGPFSVDRADHPATCSAGQDVKLGVVCDPTKTGFVKGTVTPRVAEPVEKIGVLDAPEGWCGTSGK